MTIIQAPTQIPYKRRKQKIVILYRQNPLQTRRFSSSLTKRQQSEDDLGSRKVPEPMEHGSKKVDGRSNLLPQPPGPAGSVLSRSHDLAGLSMYGTDQYQNAGDCDEVQIATRCVRFHCPTKTTSSLLCLKILHDWDDHVLSFCPSSGSTRTNMDRRVAGHRTQSRCVIAVLEFERMIMLAPT